MGGEEIDGGKGIRQISASVEHPQVNGQDEAANKLILNGLRKRLDEHMDPWADEVWSVLWSYRTIVHSTTNETPFRLTYGEEAVIPVELREPSPRMFLGTSATHESLDQIDEVRGMANLAKQRVANRYNTKARPRSFQAGDLVLRQANAKYQEHELS
ncbi:uncharacterized protein LOC107615790 [Arachis ipaensis]|uniref:uncharacterized protein LOC107615790 n=1 Tax=Arachis ipaensis TaxID=130454 RepID=UPI0007AF4B1D|nr:uncharacterized protein LOC107615790 [Arachis ipaensis]XP_025678746.1 uncharacterized protein LOC112778662 [Arachis hypogaea]